MPVSPIHVLRVVHGWLVELPGISGYLEHNESQSSVDRQRVVLPPSWVLEGIEVETLGYFPDRVAAHAV